MAKTIFRSLLFFVVIGGLYFALDYLPFNQVEEEAVTPTQNAKPGAIDGDSFRMDGDEFRLYGMDAPEYRQNCKTGSGADWPCGKEARTELASLLAQPGLTCTLSARDNYARGIATCYTDQTYDIAETMVHRGFAVASGDGFAGSLMQKTYGDAEVRAKQARRGIWQGEFVSPAIWREQNLRAASTFATPQ